MSESETEQRLSVESQLSEPPASMDDAPFQFSDYVDHVFYINLAKRTDRRAELENELNAYGVSNYERFPAIEHASGTVGCGYSHLAVLELAKERGYKNVLILEDDFTFALSCAHFQRQITAFFEYEMPYDVLMISYMKHSITKKQKTKFPGISRLLEARNASGYLVNSHYYQKLIDLYTESIPILEATNYHWIYANDQAWKEFQKVDNWFYFKKRIGMQKAGFSDIANSFMNYEE